MLGGKWLGRGWKLFKAGEHAHFGWQLLEHALDMRGWVAVFVPSAVTFVWRALNPLHSAWDVWFWTFFIAACAAIIYIAWCFFRTPKQIGHVSGQLSSAEPTPVRSTSEEPLYMTAEEVVHYMVDETEWGARKKVEVTAQGMRKIPLLESFAEFKRVAEEGKISTLGRLNGAGTHVVIPGTFWLTSTLDTNTFVRRQTNQTAPAVPDQRGIPVYTDLKILRADIYKAWVPRAVLNPPDRMTLLEFRNIARDQFGWDVSGKTNVHIMDLLFGLREAGTDGEIAFWGRRRKQVDWMTRDEVLMAIPREHWHDFEIETGNVVNGEDNLKVLTYNPRHTNWIEGSFADVHLDRRAALQWLATKAASYKDRPRF